ncbi:MAG: AAA-like domain-containing protein [Anaerolineae bacterium]|nr:AAA-like domain-containing protein [Anaerolineae bacterium]
MTKIFISYTHNPTPDEELVNYLTNYLSQHGYEIFVDKQILIGDEWPTITRQKIELSEFFIVLLSISSIESEMVIEEVRIAYRLNKKQERPIILPIRVAYYADLPYDLGSYLGRIQYALWKSNADSESVAEKLLDAINHQRTFDKSSHLPQLSEKIVIADDGNVIQSDDEITPPSPRVNHKLILELAEPGGAVELRSKFYIDRNADKKVGIEVLKKGRTICIKGARQTGKSSLLARVYAYARRNGHPAVYLTFQMIDENHLQDLDVLLRYLAELLATTLETSAPPQYFWNSLLGPKDKLSNFLKEAILKTTELPLIIVMDEVDRLFKFPYRNDFFSLIRAWHEKRAFDEVFKKLNLVLAYSTEAFLFIQNVSSPFNVGSRIELNDFDRNQLEDLNIRHGKPIRDADELDAFASLIGGHPYLARKAFYDLVTRGWSLKNLIDVALADDGPFDEHLRAHLWHLHNFPDLKTAMKEILTGNICSDDLLFYRLRSAGLVRGHDRHSTVLRCGLYTQYFSKHLL